MITTSEEAYDEYQRLKLLEEKLKRDNRGFSLICSDNNSNHFRIEIKKHSDINLAETKSKIVINSDFPFVDWRYSYGEIDVEGFLKALEEWVLIPRYKFFIQYNRKADNKASWYNLPKFRKFDIKFEDVVFDIGKQAQEEINLLGFDFVKSVEKLLLKQREATDEEAKDFERYKLLLEEVGNLERKIPKSNEYCYGEKKDGTLKITIDKKTYNSKLKKVEIELDRLCKKYSFLEMPTLRYQEILRRMSFEDWKLENEADAEDEWSNFDDEDKDEHDGDFEAFMKWCFDRYLEDNDFGE